MSCVRIVAKGSKEPIVSNAAAGANDRNAGFDTELHFDATGLSSRIKSLVGDEDVVTMNMPNKPPRSFVCTYLV